jgi:hypothetical protein
MAWCLPLPLPLSFKITADRYYSSTYVTRLANAFTSRAAAENSGMNYRCKNINKLASDLLQLHTDTILDTFLNILTNELAK